MGLAFSISLSAMSVWFHSNTKDSLGGTFGLLETALPTSALKEDKFIIIISYSKEQQPSTKQQKETNIK